MTHPRRKLSIIGGGIVGAIEAYFAFMDAKQTNEPICVTIYEKNVQLNQTTVMNLAPSLTPVEIIGLVPQGEALRQQLSKNFSEIDGICVNDLPDTFESTAAKEYINKAISASGSTSEIQQREEVLKQMGAYSMELWKKMYDTADPELKGIMDGSLFEPCATFPETFVGNHPYGYRFVTVSQVKDAAQTVNGFVSRSQNMGYRHTGHISPAEVKALAPGFTEFVDNHSAESGDQWNDNTCAVLYPGGKINPSLFLPKFYDYLANNMGQYTSETGRTKNCFRIKYNQHVTGIECSPSEGSDTTQGPTLTGLKINNTTKHNKFNYTESEYVFCPGESVNTLSKLGLAEPASAGFAGTSLKLVLPLPKGDSEKNYATLNNGLHVRYQKIGCSFQVYCKDGQVHLEIGGTKAFYGSREPHNSDAYAFYGQVNQLNLINDLFPSLISQALGKETRNTQLNKSDLLALEDKKLLTRWVGRRAVAYDAFPTLGPVYLKTGTHKITNARSTTHLGSGGVSFSPAAVIFSRNNHDKRVEKPDWFEKVRRFSASNR